MSEVCQVTHLVPVSTLFISLSRFESTATGNGVDMRDGSERIPSKDLAGLCEGIFLDGPAIDMVVVKRERQCVTNERQMRGKHCLELEAFRP
jgi:hypothetical protein